MANKVKSEMLIEAKERAERICNGEFPITYSREQVVKHTEEDFRAGAEFFKEKVFNILLENLQAMKSGMAEEDKARPVEEMVIETYEDLIFIICGKVEVKDKFTEIKSN